MSDPTPTRRRRKPVTTDDLIARRLIYPVAEAAEMLGVHRTTLYNWAREGRLELVRVGARTYVAAAELERFAREEPEPAHIGGDQAAPYSELARGRWERDRAQR